MSDRILRPALVLGLLSCIGPFAIDMYLPAMPGIGADLGTSVQGMQGTIVAYFIAFGLAPTGFSIAFAVNAIGFFTASQMAGPLGLRHGSARVMAWAAAGFAGFTVALFAVALAGPMSLWLCVAGLFLANACLGLIIPTAMVMALDEHGDIAGPASSLGGHVADAGRRRDHRGGRSLLRRQRHPDAGGGRAVRRAGPGPVAAGQVAGGGHRLTLAADGTRVWNDPAVLRHQGDGEAGPVVVEDRRLFDGEAGKWMDGGGLPFFRSGGSPRRGLGLIEADALSSVTAFDEPCRSRRALPPQGFRPTCGGDRPVPEHPLTPSVKTMRVCSGG